MPKKKRKCHFEVSYFDLEDPAGERWKTWKFKKKEDAKIQQNNLQVGWDADLEEIPVIKVCSKPKRKSKRK